MVCPWQAGEQLLLYIAKLDFMPPACHLSAPDELSLLRQHRMHPIVSRRAAFVEAALAAHSPDEPEPPPPIPSRLTKLGAELDGPFVFEGLLHPAR